MIAPAVAQALTLSSAARWYAQRCGYRVLPLRAREKTPATQHGLHDASSAESDIDAMWSPDPTRNVGIATGTASGVVVLDVDGDQGEASLAALEAQHGPLPLTAAAITGRGRHLYFAATSGKSIRNSAGRLGSGLDVRGDGGYVVAPPSVHPSGHVYRWLDGQRIDHVAPAPMPEWLTDLLVERPALRAAVPGLGLSASDAYARSALERECGAVACARPGARNARLNEAAFALGQLVAGDALREHDAHAALISAAIDCGLGKGEAERTIASGLAAGAKQPRAAPLHVHAAAGGLNGSRSHAEEQPVLVSLASVQPARVRWLWPGRVPLGKLTIVDGDPGLGKSLITLDLAARVSTAAAMPDGASPDCDGPAGVVLLSAEDDPSDTIRPRLDAAGADVTRIAALTAVRAGTRERMPSLDALAAIDRAITQTGARLVVVDPLMAYLPSGTDSHRDQDIRALLAPLGQLAAGRGVAIVIVRHLNKRSGGNPLYRGGGSIGIVGAARSGLLVARDPDDPDGHQRILAVTKSNLAAEAPALAYRVDTTNEVPRVRWLGQTGHTASDLVSEPASPDERDSLADAGAWLASELENGPRRVEELKRGAAKSGIAWRTLERAKAKLGVCSTKTGGAGAPWCWFLPIGEAATRACAMGVGGVGGVGQTDGFHSEVSKAAKAAKATDLDLEVLI